MRALKQKSQMTGGWRIWIFAPLCFRGSFSVRASLFVIGAVVLALSGLLACEPGGFRLLNQLEARNLKSEILNRRAICYEEFVNPARFASCYEKEMFDLLAAECVEIRQTEPIPQEDCEDFLYRVVMKPDSFFPGETVFPGTEDDPDEYRLTSLHAPDRPGGCDESRACVNVCKGLFVSPDARGYCAEYSVTVVTKMKGIFDILEAAASVSRLRSLNTAENQRYLKIMLNIEPTDGSNNSVLHRIDTDRTTTPDTVEPWTEDQQKEVLKWLSASSEMIRVFSTAAGASTLQNFELLSFVSDTTDAATMAVSISRSLNNLPTGDDFIDELIDENNEVGLKWLHAYFESQCSDSDTVEEKKCIFKDYYCNLDTGTGDSAADKHDYLDYDFFTDLLDNILEHQRPGTNPPNWWREETRTNDLVGQPRWTWTQICRELS